MVQAIGRLADGSAMQVTSDSLRAAGVFPTGSATNQW